jgi:hypothetical protein
MKLEASVVEIIYVPRCGDRHLGENAVLLNIAIVNYSWATHSI